MEKCGHQTRLSIPLTSPLMLAVKPESEVHVELLDETTLYLYGNICICTIWGMQIFMKHYVISSLIHILKNIINMIYTKTIKDVIKMNKL